jgi:hypothetical protein
VQLTMRDAGIRRASGLPLSYIHSPLPRPIGEWKCLEALAMDMI